MSKIRNPHVKKFLQMAVQDLRDHKIKLKWYHRTIDPVFQIEGYFDDNRMQLGVLKNQRWLETFVHEYAHFLQWKHDETSFAAYYKYDYDPVRLIEQYVQRRTAYNQKVKNAFRVVRRNEAACDRLAANLIRKYCLPIDLEYYRREANRQIVFYHCVEQKRSWQPSNKFYGMRLRQMLPSNIKTSYAERLPQKILETALELF
jgi:hypothetical protein